MHVTSTLGKLKCTDVRKHNNKVTCNIAMAIVHVCNNYTIAPALRMCKDYSQ